MKYFFERCSGFKWVLMAVFVFVTPFGAFAAGPAQPSALSFPIAQLLVTIIIFLLLAIILLANVLLGAAGLQAQQFNKEKKKDGIGAVKVAGMVLLCIISTTVFGADNPGTTTTPATNVPVNYGGLSATAFYILMSVVILELVTLLALLYNLKVLLKKQFVAAAEISGEETVVTKKGGWNLLWHKINGFHPVKEEAQIDLGHDYDGIRELDNRLPPWWLYGFYATIIFAGVYLWRYHVAHSAPLSKEELQISIAKADKEKAEYLKNSANNVDETTVKYLPDAKNLEAGKQVFTTACAACHLADGGGLVGPNLTDNYWLHGGSIQDIFKSIKYGWPEKGMKSWKDDYSPVQIAQIASYVKSLHGTKPKTPKEPQGTLYVEKGAAPDSANVTNDSAKTTPGKK